MDPISAALTVAWLGAVHRTQTAPPPGPPKPKVDNTLTDAIEGALRSGGIDSRDTDWVDPARTASSADRARPGAVVDLTV